MRKYDLTYLSTNPSEKGEVPHVQIVADPSAAAPDQPWCNANVHADQPIHVHVDQPMDVHVDVLHATPPDASTAPSVSLRVGFV